MRSLVIPTVTLLSCLRRSHRGTRPRSRRAVIYDNEVSRKSIASNGGLIATYGSQELATSAGDPEVRAPRARRGAQPGVHTKLKQVEPGALPSVDGGRPDYDTDREVSS